MLVVGFHVLVYCTVGMFRVLLVVAFRVLVWCIAGVFKWLLFSGCWLHVLFGCLPGCYSSGVGSVLLGCSPAYCFLAVSLVYCWESLPVCCFLGVGLVLLGCLVARYFAGTLIHCCLVGVDVHTSVRVNTFRITPSQRRGRESLRDLKVKGVPQGSAYLPTGGPVPALFRPVERGGRSRGVSLAR